MATVEQTIPVANLKDFTEGDAAARVRFVETVGTALHEVGFFALENHGVEEALVDAAYDIARDFFHLDESCKRKLEDVPGSHNRGYISFGREHAKGNANPDLKEFLNIGRELSPNHPSYSEIPHNVWPSELPALRPTLLRLYESLDICAASLLQACALYLELPQNLFSDMITHGLNLLRVIHYPAIPEGANPASVRAAAHTDINLITLLCESTASGLELQKKDGSWMPIHSLSGQLIVDAGDMLQNISNGFYKSTIHRVVNPDNHREERFSMPYFVHPRSEIDLSPLPECIEKTGGKALYESITAKEYLQQRIREIGLAQKDDTLRKEK